MHLEGSCHCRAVRFSVEAYAPYPYMRCYCSICRKTGGGGGYAINLGATAATLNVSGREHLRIYHALLGDPAPPDKRTESPAERHFCGRCGTTCDGYRRCGSHPKLLFYRINQLRNF